MNLKNKTFFSYATVAPMCGASYKAVLDYYKTFYEIGPPEVLYTYDPISDSMATEAAELLNCSPEEITYTKNTTEGINIAADALPLYRGDTVLVQSNEYPANLLPWMRKRQEGVDVQFISGSSSSESYQNLLAGITPKTKAIAISAIQYYDGYLTPLKELSAICRRQKIYLILDAVQMVGIRQIDLKKTPVDFLVCGGQKYLQAGVGIGFMYINKDILSHLNEPRVGIRSMEHFDDQNYTLRDTAARFQDGSQNLSGLVALHAALKRINDIGIDVIERQNLALLKEIKAMLTHNHIPFIDYGDKQGNIISMPVANPQALCDDLRKHSAYIKPIKDVARLSFVHTSRREDAEKLVDLLSKHMGTAAGR